MSRQVWMLATVYLLGCVAHWSPPVVEKISGSDGRECASTACVDLALVVDTSASVAAPVGGPDWTLRGELFGYPPPGPNSRLWVALDGAEKAIGRLDNRRVAMTLMGFAGDPYQQHPAVWIEAGLTNDFSAIASATARVRSRKPAGSSCHACAVRTAAIALGDSARRGRCPVLILLTDADPNLPVSPGSSSDFEAENRDALASSLREAWPRGGVFIVVGEGNPERAAQFERAVVEVGSQVVMAADSSEVAGAIFRAAESCER